VNDKVWLVKCPNCDKWMHGCSDVECNDCGVLIQPERAEQLHAEVRDIVECVLMGHIRAERHDPE
jgi:hypothetical protein